MDGGGGARGSPGACISERRLAERKPVMQCGRQRHGIAVSEDVHIEGRRLRAQQMIVECRDLDAAFGKLGHHRCDLGFGQHEIAHHHGGVAVRPEGEPGAEREARLQLDAIKRDMQIGARQADAIDAARHCRAGFAERSGNLAPVGFGGRGGEGGEADHARDSARASEPHDAFAHGGPREDLIKIDAAHRFSSFQYVSQKALTCVAHRCPASYQLWTLQAFPRRALQSQLVPVQE